MVTKPVTHAGDLDNMPLALAPLIERNQWCVWRWEQRPNGTWHKPPFQARNPSEHANQDDPATWSTFAEALAAVSTGQADGVTYILDETDGLGAIDVDHCRDPDTGAIAQWAQYLLDRSQSYVEVTPSGTGIRVWGTCGQDAKPLLKTLDLDHGNGARIEIFRHRKKPLTVTGYDLNCGKDLASIDRPIEWALDHGKRHKLKKTKEKTSQEKPGSNRATAAEIAALVRGPLPAGTDRSKAFGRVVWHLYGLGRPMAEVIALLESNPNGVAEKYNGRIEQEVQRLWEKAELADLEKEDQPQRWRYVLVNYVDCKINTTPKYRIKGLLPDTGVAIVWGPPKCFKSFWVFDAVMHVALGREYQGRKVLQGSVIYLALEGGNNFNNRLEAFRQRHQVQEAPFWLFSQPMRLPLEHANLIDDVRQQEPYPAVVVIDTLNRGIVGSENDPKDMSEFIKAADAIRDAFNCLVIIVHHCGVDGTRPRGHSSLGGAADAQLHATRKGKFVQVVVEWMKDGSDGDSVTCLMEQVIVGKDDNGDDLTSMVVVPSHPDLVPLNEKKLSRNEILFQEAFDCAIKAYGHHIEVDRETVRAVDLKQVQAEFYKRHKAPSDNTKWRAFSRVVEELDGYGKTDAGAATIIWRVEE
jgi:hypothetical protein